MPLIARGNFANQVSDFLLHECRERGEVLTNLKLQKLLYYAEAWFLTLYEKSLVGEDFQAWVHGPVLPSQYRRFKDNGWRPILTDVSRPDLDDFVEQHLCEIVDVFGSETATSLELMTHQERPWLEARGSLPKHEASNAIISKQTMKAYYESFADDEEDQEGSEATYPV